MTMLRADYSPGSFTLTFLFAGTLYSWGIFQADLAQRQVASALTLSAVGALQTFFQAIGCMPVRPSSPPRPCSHRADWTGNSSCHSPRPTTYCCPGYGIIRPQLHFGKLHNAQHRRLDLSARDILRSERFSRVSRESTL